MKISVVIPTYNEEKYLPKTLKSIHDLSRQPDEILIIDASSTDSTVSLAKKNDARVISVPHRGIGFARQRGLEEAKGDVIAFTDADTIVPKNWLTIIEEKLNTKGVSGVYGSYRVDGGWFPYVFIINVIQPAIFHFLYLIGLPLAPGQNTAFWRSKGFEAGGYPVNFKSCEDIEMIRRLKTVGKILYTPKNCVLSSGRRGNEGINWIFRMTKGLALYYTTRKADTFSFPDIR